MIPYATVTEVINGTISEPRIFRELHKATDFFYECLAENGAEVVHTDDFCIIGENGSRDNGYQAALHIQVEIQ
jgi:hypothetical protein